MQFPLRCPTSSHPRQSRKGNIQCLQCLSSPLMAIILQIHVITVSHAPRSLPAPSPGVVVRLPDPRDNSRYPGNGNGARSCSYPEAPDTVREWVVTYSGTRRKKM